MTDQTVALIKARVDTIATSILAEDPPPPPAAQAAIRAAADLAAIVLSDFHVMTVALAVLAGYRKNSPDPGANVGEKNA